MAKGLKCFCCATLRPDGKCPHGCDPALRGPGRRRIVAERARRVSAAVYTRGFLGAEEAREGLVRALPERLRVSSIEQSRRAKKMRRLGNGLNPAPGY